MSDDEDAAFSANRSDDGNGPAIDPKTAICKTCGLEYTLSGVNVDIIFLDMCDSCSEILKAKLKDIPSMNESPSIVEHSRSTSSDGLQEDSTLNSGVVIIRVLLKKKVMTRVMKKVRMRKLITLTMMQTKKIMTIQKMTHVCWGVIEM
jgi:hypothetical protein